MHSILKNSKVVFPRDPSLDKNINVSDYVYGGGEKLIRDTSENQSENNKSDGIFLKTQLPEEQ